MADLEKLKKFTLAISRHESIEHYEAENGPLSKEDRKIWKELEAEVRVMEKNGIAVDLPFE